MGHKLNRQSATNKGNNMIDLPQNCTTQPSKKLTGNSLKLHDAEVELINSGPLGMKRLAHMRAIDIQEAMPAMSDEDAQKAGAGYVMGKILGMNGHLTEKTKAEIKRLKNE